MAGVRQLLLFGCLLPLWKFNARLENKNPDGIWDFTHLQPSEGRKGTSHQSGSGTSQSQQAIISYGVMLLEIISCRKCTDFQTQNEEEAIITDWAYDCYRGHRLDKLVENDDDARSDTRLERLVMVAIWCIQEDPCLRPSMRNVIQMLEGVVAVPMPPISFPL
ncbi:G-type lectin S-receptor-like serine/threonine-protein kinase LECRK1 [Vitis vinifera]|uniref:G-type lectin S-receptor-like serine/threonine-protein kinase LECRK1 n=1 Tax=Vitis vinifera TaxID=29760 RepID=A0A438IAC6_VITVI|nr:G-type lectin S-receptor-like serine/threonine-protein kinase LECRK1 [Vitis vinifera]